MLRSFFLEALFFEMKGKYLISSPNLLNDAVFYKSIIYIVDETSQGLTGIILNKKSGFFLSDHNIKTLKNNIELFYGGPVSNNLFYILRTDDKIEGSIRISEDIYWGNNIDLIIDTLREGLVDIQNINFYKGYSGWDIGQLDNEIQNNSWIVKDELDIDHFTLVNNKSWNNMIKNIGGKYKIWSNSPDDINLN